MKYFKVKNFEKYQPKRNGKNAPWIRLYHGWNLDSAVGQLHDSHKAHWIGLLSIAHTENNRIPFDNKWIKKRGLFGSPVKLELFVRLGLIEILDDKLFSGDGIEKPIEKEKKKEKKKEKNNKTPESDCHIAIAKFFYEKKRAVNPKSKEPDYESWARELRLLEKKEGLSEEELRNLIEWVYQDSFWSGVCLSPGNLSKNAEKIQVKMRAQSRQPKSWQEKEDEAFLNGR